jgi:ABC-type transporter Mla maintaining outer membrane lipid asymmetry permease subunit MlaE
VRGGPTGVPVAASQAVVTSILLIFVSAALFALVLH